MERLTAISTYILPSLHRRAQSPDSLAVGLCVRNVPIICQEKVILHLGYYAMHYKHMHSESESFV
jgi:hypothetical protein